MALDRRSAAGAAATVLMALLAPAAAMAQAAASSPAAPAIIDAQIDAFNKGDLAQFVSYYASDIEMFDLGPDAKPNLQGAAALSARYAPIFAKYHPHATILSRIVQGDFVIDHERTSAGSRSSDGVAIYQIEKGKIRRVWFTP